MPAPKKGETKQEYLSRCIPYILNEDNGITDADQAAARCYGLWDSAKEAERAKFSYASTQIDIPESHPIAKEAQNLWIPDLWLHDYGVEKDSHITVKYGLNDPQALSKIRNILSKIPPFDIKLQGISIFEHEEYDVVKVDILSPELLYIHKKIGEAVTNNDENPLYRPHMTLAYFWPGKGKNLVEDRFYRDIFMDSKFHVSEITYSDENGRKTSITLGNKIMATKEKTRNLVLEAVLVPMVDEAELTGTIWEVTIIGPSTPEHLITIGNEDFIRSKNGRLYPITMVEASTPDWDGIKVYDNHLTDEEFIAKQGMRSPKAEWLGTIVDPWFDSKESKLKAIFKLVEDDLAKKLKNAWEQDVLKSIGLSIDTFVQSDREVMYEGASFPVVDGFDQIVSVDLVGDPAAGGSLDRLIASTQVTFKKETKMDEDEIKTLIDEKLGDLTQSVTSAVLEALKKDDDETPDTEAETEEEAPETEAEDQDDDEQEQENEAVAEAIKESKMARCELTLYRILADAKLPKEMNETVQQIFEGRIFIEADLKKMVTSMKKVQAALDPSGRVTEANSGRIQVGSAPQDKAEVEFLRLLAGNTAFRNLEHSTNDIVKERMTEGYKSWIKEGRPNYGTMRLSQWVYDMLGGNPLSDHRAYEAITTSGMTSIVKNTLNLMIAADYSVREEWWAPFVRIEEVDNIDDATLVRVYGMDTLDVVEEGQPYTELGWEDEEETASFVKRGNYAGVTLETLLNDKLNVVRSIPQRLSNSWYNTMSDLNAAVFTTNTAAGPVLADTGALFNATAVGTAGGHANLLTTVFGTTTAAYAAARLAMRKQTDQTLGTGRRMGIIPRFILVPYDLEVAANVVMATTDRAPGQANYDINPYAQESVVIGVPQWTDATDWALVADPNQFPAIWNIFLRGMRVPQLFTSDQETAGAMFTNDVLRYKIRLMTWRFSSTNDCAPVSDWRPLHKNNCT